MIGSCSEPKHEAECSWCVFMKGGPCYKSFTMWQGELLFRMIHIILKPGYLLCQLLKEKDMFSMDGIGIIRK